MVSADFPSVNTPTVAEFRLPVVSQEAQKGLIILSLALANRRVTMPAPLHPSCPRGPPNHTEGEHHFQLLRQKEKWLKYDWIIMTHITALHVEGQDAGGFVGQTGAQSSFLNLTLLSPWAGGREGGLSTEPLLCLPHGSASP